MERTVTRCKYWPKKGGGGLLQQITVRRKNTNLGFLILLNIHLTNAY